MSFSVYKKYVNIAEKKIVIEIDGAQHKIPQNKASDIERDRVLSSWGITVLRYSNDSMRNNFNAVAEDILRKLALDFSCLKPPK